MPHLPPAHHEASKQDSPNDTKIKEKQNETVMDSNSNLAKSITHHNQTKELTTWFLNHPLMSPLTRKAQSLKFESKTLWSTARRPKKSRKTKEGHLEEGKPQKPIKRHEKRQSQSKWQIRVKKSSEEQEKLKIKAKAQNRSKSILPLKLTPPNTLNASSPP
jgi:hypothetical protein